MFKGLWINGRSEGYTALQPLHQAAGFDESDPIDAMAAHILIYDEGDVPCATGRLYPVESGWRVDRIFVLPERRGQGYGDLVMRMLLFRATQAYDEADISAPLDPAMQAFFARYGFTESGGEMRVNGKAVDLSGSCGG